MNDFTTRIIHAGIDRDPLTGASSIPVYHATTFHQKDPTDIGEYDYSRSGNPTRHALEKAIAELEGGVAGYAFSTGMAATSSVLLLFQPGDHIILSEDIYGGTFRVINTIFARWGLESSFVDTSNPENIIKAIKSNTRALFIESPSNPLLRITDLRSVLDIAKERKLISIIDATFTTPFLQRPLELGFDIVVHSATKFINGHCDVLAGLVVAKDRDIASRLKFVQNAFGAVLSAQDSWLVLRGLKTLGVRLKAQQETATDLARRFHENHDVSKVYYPGLVDHPGHEVHMAQSAGGGAILSLEFSSEELAEEVLRHLELPLLAVSLGGVETIVTYPVTMSHAAMPPAERALRGITGKLIRISVGLESADDIYADFCRALEKAKTKIAARCSHFYQI